ncbi:MAG TPA: S41 family peptidase [Ornithinibacter sp.]|nr:S41 family peptidase [Ornithinibacter sp.]
MDTTDPTLPAPAPAPADVAVRCADLVAERFVLPEVGERAATRLRRRAAAGAYDGLDPAALAAALSADLEDVAHDLHLRVIHHPGGVPPTEDPAAYEAYWREAARTSAGGMRRVERLPGNVAVLSVGPVLTPPTPSWDAVSAALSLVADADALVLDVRECRGGDPDTVQLLVSHLVGDEPVRLVDIESRAEGVRQRWTHPVAARRFGPDRPLVVLTSATTFSGGEEVAFDVQLLGRGRVVGERTRGGANPREGVAVHPELELAVPVARALHPRDGSSWEGVGVRPDVECPAERALDRALALVRRD